MVGHSDWAFSIVAKYSRIGKPRGFRPESLVNFQVYQRIVHYHSNRRTPEIRCSLVPVCNPSDARLSSTTPPQIVNRLHLLPLGRTVAQIRPPGEFSRVTVLAPRAATGAGGQLTLMPRAASVPVAVSSNESRGHLFGLRASPVIFKRLLPSQNAATAERTLSYRRAAYPEATSHDIVPRVNLQYTRVEDRFLIRDRGISSSTAEIPPEKMAVLARTRSLAQTSRASELEPEQATRRNSTLVPDVDVSQIADQVMKQLDRRFVAARERMGRV
jgi:hypothetical protein